jgi:iron complex outermembrane recepter protein
VAWHVDWYDLQGSAPQRGPGVLPTDPNVIENRGTARARGVELELGYAPTDRLVATLLGSWQDPKYRSATFLGNVACDGVRCTPGMIDADGAGNGNLDGRSLERQSQLQGSLLLSYGRSLPNGWNAYGNLDVNHQGRQYLEPLNLGSTGARTLTNVRLGLADEHWEVALWSRNLLDERYVASSLVIFQPNAYVVALGERRTWGVDVRVRL